jgi:predicted PurR-regulated permease PerM
VAEVPTLATFAIIASVALFLYLVRNILLPFVLGGVIAYVCTPLIDWLVWRTRTPRWVWALAILGVLIAILVAVGFFAAPSLVGELARTVGNLHGVVEQYARELMGGQTYTVFGQSLSATQVADYLVQDMRNWLNQPGRVFLLGTLGFAVFFGFFLTGVIAGYLLNDAAVIGRGLIWLVPPDHRPFARRIWADLDPILRRYFIGVGLVVVYASVAAYIGLGLILGIQHAVFLALLTGVLEVIPIVGPGASAVIAGLVAVQQAHSAWGILGYVIYASLLRISIDQFFGPIVLGKAAYIRPVLVIFCFLTGALLFGIIGVILAVPVALAVKSALKVLYQRDEAVDA